MATRGNKSGRGALGAALRFVAAVMMTSGLMLLADAGITLAWQEPVSALIGARQQAVLEDQLESRERALAAEIGGAGPGSDGELGRRELDAAAERAAEQTGEGDAVGRIEFPTLDREYVMVEGTDTATLRKGPAHYPDTALPGQGRTVAVAGHRTTYGAPFRTIDKLAPGDEIVVSMPYARVTYEVERQRIVPPTETSVVDDVGHEQLVLSACHPLYSAAERIIVFARLAEAEPI